MATYKARHEIMEKDDVTVDGTPSQGIAYGVSIGPLPPACPTKMVHCLQAPLSTILVTISSLVAKA